MDIKDLIIVGGGINGAGVAVDATGRGLSVLLLEAQDLAGATSSSSSKLIHGGLRYLEYYEFRLVSESLAEREVVLKMAPHICYPLRFRLPHQPHLRPAWMIRSGLFLYDFLGKKMTLPKSHGIRFGADSVLKPELTRGFEYSDCWIDDARLVLSNALEIVRQGGEVRTRTEVTKAYREGDLWRVEATCHNTGETLSWLAKGVVNAAGPWTESLFNESFNTPSPKHLELVKGSHIVVPKAHNESQAYILQNKDNRIVFVIPWLNEFTIIGTTDVKYNGDPRECHIDENETQYLLNIYNDYFKKTLSHSDIVWSFSGVRPLVSDAHSDTPQSVTRDYVLELDHKNGAAPLLSIFGGKLTTYRKLAEHVMEKLQPYYPNMGSPWTERLCLPGGNIDGTTEHYTQVLKKRYTWLSDKLAHRYAHTYGKLSEILLNDVASLADMGQEVAPNLFEVELRYLVDIEWVQQLDDLIWRRTKLGLWLTEAEKQAVADWLVQYRSKAS